MGARAVAALISFLARGNRDAVASATSLESGLDALPESCLAAVLVNLDPLQICRLAMLNKTFRGAASADCVWESKLPVNYRDIIDSVFGEGEFVWEDSCKRDVYSRLCRPNFFDAGTKKVWLDKSTGKACMLVSSKGLAITGIHDRRYWKRTPADESIFSSVAYLQQIWWFEVEGEIEFPFPPGAYSVFFRIQLGRTHRRFGRRVCNSEQVHGWDRKPVIFQLSSQQASTKQCHLNKEKPGKWIHCHAGDFTVGDSCRSTKVKFSMTQTDCTHTKGGLSVDSVVIYPAEYKESFMEPMAVSLKEYPGFWLLC